MWIKCFDLYVVVVGTEAEAVKVAQTQTCLQKKFQRMDNYKFKINNNNNNIKNLMIGERVKWNKILNYLSNY